MDTEQRYVVIRVKGYDKASAQLGRGELDLSPDDVAVETEELSPRHIRDLERDPTIPAMSPSMPISLIEPMRKTGAGEEPPPGDSWGLKAIGADVTQCDGAGVTVSVLDTGIDASHPAFAGVKITEKDFSHSGNGDVDGHGSHCAGTIFGRPVNGVHIGVAHGVHKALIGKVLSNNGGGSSEWLYQAIQWAISNHAHVISMSLGFDFPQMSASLVKRGYTVAQATSAALEAYRKNLRVFDALMQLSRAYRSLGHGGTIVVAATGNESTAKIPIAASMPAAAEGVIAVGALGQLESGLALADFSNALPTVVAPGVDVLSVRAGGGLTTMSGTSMATPHVAGIAALWWQHGLRARKETNARDVEAQILAHARPPVAHAAKGSHSHAHAPDWGNGLVAAP